MKDSNIPMLHIPFSCLIFLYNTYHHLTYLIIYCLTPLTRIECKLNEDRGFSLFCLFLYSWSLEFCSQVFIEYLLLPYF